MWRRVPDWVHDSANYGWFAYRMAQMLVFAVFGLPFYLVAKMRRKDGKQSPDG